MSPTGCICPSSRCDLGIAAVAFGWITVMLITDPSSSLGQQRAWSAATWVVLLWLLRAETPLVRTQVAVVVVFATAVEYTFSLWLEVYVYRLDNVPAFVSPAHGLVYLCALALGRSPALRRWRVPLIALTLAAGAAYALWGLLGTDRVDVLGAFWFGCLAVFLTLGRSRLLYVGLFAIVTYLELLGTWVGVWEWQPLDPTGLIGIGNPPSGVAGGYGWFDLAALTAAPALLRAWERLTHASRPERAVANQNLPPWRTAARRRSLPWSRSRIASARCLCGWASGIQPAEDAARAIESGDPMFSDRLAEADDDGHAAPLDLPIRGR